MLSHGFLEIYITLANIFGRLELELFETDEKSMEFTDRGLAVLASRVKVKAKSLVD